MIHTYKFRLYDSKQNRKLDDIRQGLCGVYNHVVAIHRRWYSLYGKRNAALNKAAIKSVGGSKDEAKKLGLLHSTYIHRYKIFNHLTKLKKTSSYDWMTELNAQSIQDAAERIDRAYRLFFKLKKKGIKCSPPGFKASRRYCSFTLKQSGWKLLPYDPKYPHRGFIRICGQDYKYVKDREILSKTQRVTVKKDLCGSWWIYVTCKADEETQSEERKATGKMAGADFGLKTFLTIAGSDGSTCKVQAEFPMKEALSKLRGASRRFSKKVEAHKALVQALNAAEAKGQRRSHTNANTPKSKRYHRARLELAKLYRKMTWARQDWHWKLAKRLADEYDTIYVEDLCFKGMSKRWGRKMSDLGAASFMSKLAWKCQTQGSKFERIDRWESTTQTCSSCGSVREEKLPLSVREWVCPICGAEHDRDVNAAKNILKAGASASKGVPVRRSDAEQSASERRGR